MKNPHPIVPGPHDCPTCQNTGFFWVRGVWARACPDCSRLVVVTRAPAPGDAKPAEPDVPVKRTAAAPPPPVAPPEVHPDRELAPTAVIKLHHERPACPPSPKG